MQYIRTFSFLCKFIRKISFYANLISFSCKFIRTISYLCNSNRAARRPGLELFVWSPGMEQILRVWIILISCETMWTLDIDTI